MGCVDGVCTIYGRLLIVRDGKRECSPVSSPVYHSLGANSTDRILSTQSTYRRDIFVGSVLVYVANSLIPR